MRRTPTSPISLTSVRAAGLFACCALLACSSKSAGGGGDGGDANVGDAAAVTDAGGDVSSADGGVDAFTDGNVSGDTGGDALDDTGTTLVIDAVGQETPACTHLNIGILGNPGADASSNFQTWLQDSGTSVQRIQTTADVPLTADVLHGFDVVILDWLTRDYTATEASTFAAWVSAGGGVATMSGYSNNTTDDWHANSLLAPLGVAYSGPLLNGPVTSFATSPITAGLTSVTFDGGYAISDLGGTASTRTPIAFLPGGTGTVTVGFAVEMGSGHAFVWGDEWIEFDSEWSTLPEIKQLWVQVFGWAAPTSKCALAPPS